MVVEIIAFPLSLEAMYHLMAGFPPPPLYNTEYLYTLMQ